MQAGISLHLHMTFLPNHFSKTLVIHDLAIMGTFFSFQFRKKCNDGEYCWSSFQRVGKCFISYKKREGCKPEASVAQWPERSPFTSEVAGPIISENARNVTRTQYPTHTKELVNTRSQKSWVFSERSGFFPQGSWQGELGQSQLGK